MLFELSHHFLTQKLLCLSLELLLEAESDLGLEESRICIDVHSGLFEQVLAM